MYEARGGSAGHCVLHLRAQAASADVHPLAAAVDQHAPRLHVGAELAIGPWRLALPASGVLVANVAPECHRLVAEVTGPGGHRSVSVDSANSLVSARVGAQSD